jgi:integration host factor subunit beta
LWAPLRRRDFNVSPAREAGGEESPMTKSELIERLADRQQYLPVRDIETSVRLMLDQMMEALGDGERIEIRGFGSFTLNYRRPRMGRNPKTGETVALGAKYVPHFKPGKELRERVNAAVKGDG